MVKKKNKSRFLQPTLALSGCLKLETVDRKWFWHKLTKRFNDPTYNPPVRETKTHVTFDKFSADYDGFPGSADKLEREFLDVRKVLTQALANFRKSGMGDDRIGEAIMVEWEQNLGERYTRWVTQEERDAQATKIYSSKFSDFLRGDAVMEYCYNLLIEHELLESTSADMPVEATHSSDSKRKIGSKNGKNPMKGVRPRAAGTRKRTKKDNVSSPSTSATQ